VVNLGIPGDSTQCQIERLSSFLSKHKTDIAILLTGRNNENEIQSWQIRDTFFKRFTKRLKNMKIYKITEYAIGCFLKPKAKIQQDNITIKTKYENYIRYQLMKAKNLCEKHNCKLLLLSYYDGPDEYIEKFAEKSGIFYFDISKDFQRAVPEYELSHFLSPDKSHMNRRGYRIFSELLYQQLFSHQASLGLKLNVLLKTTDEASFYKNTTEANDGITAQQKRIREMPRNPYELIQLGHIYMEINEKQKARQCYIKALEQSGYADNNTIVSPIINWYLGENMPEEAYKICHKIIAHNKDSCIATCYLDYIKEKYRYVEE
jgi:lysophospholipase L1-like esterase